jgi:energy-coupling factor transporter ATP-binding protein EcfA2
MRVTSVRFRNFKALRDYSATLERMNVLVGPNNSGKSTILSAFRALQSAIQHARARKPEHLGTRGWAYRISHDALPLSLENIHTNYDDIETSLEFRVSGGGELRIEFPSDGGCLLFARTDRGSVTGPGTFRKHFDIEVAAVPVLGPVEHQEPLLDPTYVRRSMNTHRASRHFRNYWRQNEAVFEEFRDLLTRTWPGMDIELPTLTVGVGATNLSMMCIEERVPRELFWAGFGFQVWSQLLTHIVRGRSASLLVLDEPEIYLHPDVQRQLVAMLRDLGPDIVLATHSTEIMAEAEPSEMLFVDKSKKLAKRLRDHAAIQTAFESIGSFHNVTLTQLARNRRLLFVEGRDDFGILRRFAKVIGLVELAGGLGLTIAESGGFAAWERVRSFAWGVSTALDESLAVGAIFDRDYRCVEEVDSIAADLRQSLQFARILQRKEIENYLLAPELMERALEAALRERERRSETTIERLKSAKDILDEVTSAQKDDCMGQYIAKRAEFLRNRKVDAATVGSETVRWFNAKWDNLATRVEIVPGKETLRAFRSRVSELYGLTLTDARIIGSCTGQDVAPDMRELLLALNEFRVAMPLTG